MHKIEYIQSGEEGRMGVCTPYNEEFVRELKQVVPSAKFAKTPKSVWFFDEEAKGEVMALVRKYFVDVRKVLVKWDLSRATEVTVDGARVISIFRDNWVVSREDVPPKVIRNGLSCTGSHRYPSVTGELVLEVLMRDGAIIYPEPTSIEDSPEPQPKPNPLVAVPVADMLAEVERRGEELVEAIGAMGYTVIRPKLEGMGLLAKLEGLLNTAVATNADMDWLWLVAKTLKKAPLGKLVQIHGWLGKQIATQSDSPNE